MRNNQYQITIQLATHKKKGYYIVIMKTLLKTEKRYCTKTSCFSFISVVMIVVLISPIFFFQLSANFLSPSDKLIQCQPLCFVFIQEIFLIHCLVWYFERITCYYAEIDSLKTMDVQSFHIFPTRSVFCRMLLQCF